MKSIGPRMELCGTPVFIFNVSENVSPVIK